MCLCMVMTFGYGTYIQALYITDWISIRDIWRSILLSGNYARQPLKTSFVQRLLSTVVVNTLLCSARNQHDRERPADSTANMKRLLSHLRNLPLKRKIATALGLSDVLLSLSPT